MVTGDAPSTAQSIAHQVGIITSDVNGIPCKVDAFSAIRLTPTLLKDRQATISLDIESQGGRSANALVIEGKTC